MSDITTDLQAQAQPPVDVGVPPPAATAGRPTGRRPLALTIALLGLLSFGVRWATLQPAPAPTPREATALAQTAPGGVPERGHSPADGTAALFALARRFAPEPRFPADAVEGWPSPPDPSIVALRRLGAMLGALATVLLASAAGILGGFASALVAGGLLALTPGSVEASVAAGPSPVLLLSSAGALLGLTLWRRTGSTARAGLTGVFGGLAAAAGGGGAALLLAAPWAAAPGRKRAFALATCLIAAVFAMAIAAPGSLAGLPALPIALASTPLSTSSPLVAGLRWLATSAGWLAAALAVAGMARTLVRRDGAQMPALVATLAFVLVTLLRSGAEPALLAGALPGLFLFAGLALSESCPGERPLPMSRALVGFALVLSAVGAGQLIAARHAPKPADAASDWIRRNLPNGASFLLEEPDVLVPTARGLAALKDLRAKGVVSASEIDAYAAGSKVFGPVPLPDRHAPADEAALFYDGNFGPFFPWMILRDPPPNDEVPADLRTVRKLFHEYFKSTWKEVAHFDPGASRAARLVVLARPEKFELDRSKLGEMGRLLGSDAMKKRRESSTALTAWVKKAGVDLLAAGDLLGARAFNRLATERDSTDVDAHFQLARVYLLQQNREEAKRSLLTVLGFDAQHGGAHYNLGLVLEDEGDLAGAETEYRAAIQFLAAPAIAHARLGALLQKRGDAAAARQELDTVRQLDPGGEADRYLSSILGAP